MKLLLALFLATAVYCFGVSGAAKVSSVGQTAKACHNTCRFRFCDYKINFRISGRSRVAFTGAICSNVGTKIGLVQITGEAYVFEGRNIVKISKWRPAGLKKPFSATFFKSYTLHPDNLSGIGHEEVQKNQLWFLKNRCFVLPLKSYQVLHRYGYVVGKEYPKGSPFLDCVEFITRTTSRIVGPVSLPKKLGLVHGGKKLASRPSLLRKRGKF